MKINKIYQGDCLKVLKSFPDESIDMCITSPPYWALRDYGVDGQLGLEPTFQEYITKLCDIFDEVKRVLKKTGICWVVIGDTYGGSGGSAGHTLETKNLGRKTFEYGAYPSQAISPKDMGKCLLQIPSRFAIEMVNRGWILRNEIIWYKQSCMPASVTDRFTVDFEKIFFFTKNKKYYFKQQTEPSVDPESYSGRRARSPGLMMSMDKKNYAKAGSFDKNGKDLGVGKKYPNRNKRCVWTINPKPFKEAHFAVYPKELITTPIKAGCPKGGIVFDPFIGSGTTAIVAKNLDRNYIGIELNPDYIKMAEDRIKHESPDKLL